MPHECDGRKEEKKKKREGRRHAVAIFVVAGSRHQAKMISRRGEKGEKRTWRGERGKREGKKNSKHGDANINIVHLWAKFTEREKKKQKEKKKKKKEKTRFKTSNQPRIEGKGEGEIKKEKGEGTKQKRSPLKTEIVPRPLLPLLCPFSQGNGTEKGGEELKRKRRMMAEENYFQNH